MKDDNDGFLIMGLTVAAVLVLVTLAGLGVIDMDDTKQREPLAPPTQMETP